MSNWAHIGRGPRVVWIAKNEPRYSLADINDWLNEVNASILEAKSA
jgi:nitrate reductase alpha subunit